MINTITWDLEQLLPKVTLGKQIKREIIKS